MPSSASDPNPDNPMTDEAFHDRLNRLIRAAATNGVEVEGGWACRNDGDDRPDWDIEIVEVRTGVNSSE